MNPRTLDQVIGELNSTFNPQIDAIKQRQAQIPGQVQAEETALQAKQTQAFDDILGGARRRGTGVAFGGIPLSEQAKYTSTEFLPALARMKSTAREQSMSLDDAINSIYEKRNTLGYQIKQNEDQLFESRRQFDQNMAWEKEKQAQALRESARQMAAASAMPSMGSLMSGAGGGSGLPEGMGEKRNKLGQLEGYTFTVNGKPASAATFAAANKLPVGDLLYQMGASGDKTAQGAYNWLKSIQGSQMFKSGAYKNTPAYKNLSSIFWGS